MLVEICPNAGLFVLRKFLFWQNDIKCLSFFKALISSLLYVKILSWHTCGYE